MLTIGLTCLVIALLSTTLIYLLKKKSYLLKHIVRLLLIGIVAVTLYLTHQTKLIEIYYKDYPEYIELFKKVLAKPNDYELRKEWVKEGRKIKGN